jgi:glycosyltransferase involved in cell wall biosynthesis
MPQEALRQAQAVILVGSAAPEIPRQLRPQAGDQTRFLVWSGHAYDQPAMAPLAEPSARAAWDGVVCVSRWQAQTYAHTFDLDPARIHVLANAMSPAFANLFNGPILPHKPWPPIMAYASTPFRGLDRLLDAMPLIRRQFPQARLKVFSSLAVYNQDPLHDQYQSLYQRCAATNGVEYIGGLSQPELARALKGVNLLAYPNTFPETSCITAMEACAAGCLIVTSRLGALPETLAGLATLTPASIDRFTHVQDFAQAVTAVLAAWPPSEQTLAAQIDSAARHFSWPARAAQWEEMLERG